MLWLDHADLGIDLGLEGPGEVKQGFPARFLGRISQLVDQALSKFEGDVNLR